MSTSSQSPRPHNSNRIEPVSDPLKTNSATVNPPSSSSDVLSTSESLTEKSLTKDKARSKSRKRKKRNMCPKCKQWFPNITMLEIHRCSDVESESREKTLSERGLAGGAFNKIEKI